MARVVLLQNGDKKPFSSLKYGFCWHAIFNIGVIGLYFMLSIGLTFYQRWFYQKFRYPLTVVVCHLVIKFLAAALFRWVWHCCHHDRRRVSIGWDSMLRKLTPTGLASGLDIGLSNWGIELITVSLYTMTKSTSVIFILMFALIFRLERMSWSLIAIVAMISGGIVMFTYKSTQFNLFGFILVLAASLSSGLRWTMAQLVMQRSDLGLHNPLDMLYHMQPWMLLSVVPFAISFEGSKLLKEWSLHAETLRNSEPVAILILIGGMLALTMELAEYLVLSRTSSLTLSISGIFKEVCTLVLAVEWNGDEMSLLNAAGLVLCVGGIACHAWHKVARPPAGGMSAMDEASARFLADSSTSDDDDDNKDDSSTEVLFSVLHSRDR